MPRCTYCGGTEFFNGPSGGLSQNILCTNTNCRHWFNFSIFVDRLEDLNKVEPTEEEKASQEKEVKAKKMMQIRVEIAEGEKIYSSGMPVEDCFVDEVYGYTALTHADAHRVVGWLAAWARQK